MTWVSGCCGPRRVEAVAVGSWLAVLGPAQLMVLGAGLIVWQLVGLLCDVVRARLEVWRDDKFVARSKKDQRAVLRREANRPPPAPRRSRRRGTGGS